MPPSLPAFLPDHVVWLNVNFKKCFFFVFLFCNQHEHQAGHMHPKNMFLKHMILKCALWLCDPASIPIPPCAPIREAAAWQKWGHSILNVSHWNYILGKGQNVTFWISIAPSLLRHLLKGPNSICFCMEGPVLAYGYKYNFHAQVWSIVFRYKPCNKSGHSWITL